MQPSLTAFSVLAYVGVFPSLAAYLTFNRGVHLIGANRAGPFFHLIPVFGSAIAILFLGERPALFHAVGYALILGGIFIAQRGRPPHRHARRARLERQPLHLHDAFQRAHLLQHRRRRPARPPRSARWRRSPARDAAEVEGGDVDLLLPSSVPSRPMKPGLSSLVM